MQSLNHTLRSFSRLNNVIFIDKGSFEMPNVPIWLLHAKRTAQLERKHGSEAKVSLEIF